MIDRFAVILGAMKCGTTALFKTLRQHPEVAPSRVKEPNFLVDPEQRAGGPAAYEAFWDFDPTQHRWALEASTGYAKLPMRPNAAVFAKNYGAEFRFIYVVRDPVERIRSQYVHSLAEGWMTQSIERGVNPTALMLSDYWLQLRPYELLFGREQLLVLTFEELRADLVGVTERAAAFLGVERGFPFRHPGSQNDSDRYRRKIFIRLAEQAGLPSEALSAASERSGSLARLIEGLCVDHPELAGTFEQLRAEIDRSTRPSPAQAQQILETLGPDLDRFAAEWGIDPRQPQSPTRPLAHQAIQ